LVRAPDCSDALANARGRSPDRAESERRDGSERNMAYIYILKSRKNGNFYVGSTDNLDQRIKQHKAGQVHTTRRLLPVDVVFKQECEALDIAKKVERRIKRLKRRDYIQQIIKDGYIKIFDRI